MLLHVSMWRPRWLEIKSFLHSARSRWLVPACCPGVVSCRPWVQESLAEAVAEFSEAQFAQRRALVELKSSHEAERRQLTMRVAELQLTVKSLKKREKVGCHCLCV